MGGRDGWRGGWVRIIRLLLGCALALLAAGCGKEPPRVQSGLVLHTVVSLTAHGDAAGIALAESMARLEELEKIFDPENPASDIARLNAAAGGAPIPISADTYRLLRLSQEYSARTEGAWDITIGPLSRLWREALRQGAPPDPAAVAAARQLVDWRQLYLAPDGSASLLKEGMAIDPGGALKGLALDEVRRIFARHHIEHGLVNLGRSSLWGVGVNGRGEPWQIALRHPRLEPPARLGVVALRGAVLSTSGDYEQFFLAGGQRFHHLIDPRSGWPAAGSASVTVALSAEDPDAGLTADILSTALLVMGEPGAALLPSGASAIFAAPDGSVRCLGAPLTLSP